jgi:hypothetical protein
MGVHGLGERRPVRTLAVFAVVAVFTMTLFGCARSTTLSPGSPSSPSSAPIACGSISHGLGGRPFPPTSTTTPAQGVALSCFWRTYQAHQPASLTYTSFGVDTGTIYTFTLHACNGGACALSDAHAFYMAPGSPRPVGTYDCSGLRRDVTGDLIAEQCGKDGDITIAAA